MGRGRRDQFYLIRVWTALKMQQGPKEAVRVCWAREEGTEGNRRDKAFRDAFNILGSQ